MAPGWGVGPPGSATRERRPSVSVAIRQSVLNTDAQRTSDKRLRSAIIEPVLMLVLVQKGHERALRSDEYFYLLTPSVGS